MDLLDKFLAFKLVLALTTLGVLQPPVEHLVQWDDSQFADEYDPRLQPDEPKIAPIPEPAIEVEEAPEPVPAAPLDARYVDRLTDRVVDLEDRMEKVNRSLASVADGVKELVSRSPPRNATQPLFSLQDIREAAKEGAREGAEEAAQAGPIAEGPAMVMDPGGVGRIISIDGVPVSPDSQPDWSMSQQPEFAPQYQSREIVTDQYEATAIPKYGGTQLMVEPTGSQCYIDDSGNQVCPDSQPSQGVSRGSFERLRSGGRLRGMFRR